jgi:hypothetical protein
MEGSKCKLISNIKNNNQEKITDLLLRYPIQKFNILNGFLQIIDNTDALKFKLNDELLLTGSKIDLLVKDNINNLYLEEIIDIDYIQPSFAGIDKKKYIIKIDNMQNISQIYSLANVSDKWSKFFGHGTNLVSSVSVSNSLFYCMSIQANLLNKLIIEHGENKNTYNNNQINKPINEKKNNKENNNQNKINGGSKKKYKNSDNKPEQNKPEQNKPEQNKPEQNKPEQNKPEQNKTNQDKNQNLTENIVFPDLASINYNNIRDIYANFLISIPLKYIKLLAKEYFKITDESILNTINDIIELYNLYHTNKVDSFDVLVDQIKKNMKLYTPNIFDITIMSFMLKINIIVLKPQQYDLIVNSKSNYYCLLFCDYTKTENNYIRFYNVVKHGTPIISTKYKNKDIKRILAM